ncbi:NADP-dependent oxidoreductase [Streptomyces liangshanensis]|uniref:NADP-dependent oxidoreductase n=1 Tax=Streptomyces liangshanensis TaxID=2717324 RepID=A0A6G9GT96_9ACTN|nr:NADP-dependent oxidoreductase [Streptomyces liangshanensis]QIQ01420.1 NADP-dependent oxidoreductase [Streptomyces liangshanensis]
MTQAYVFTSHGGPETEALLELPDQPEPGPGQLLVAVRAAGVNPFDHKLRTGFQLPGAPPTQFPAVFGGEVAGVVQAVGPDVTGFAVGDAVFGSAVTGGYIESTLVPAAVAAHKPDALSFTDAATLPVAAATAYDGVNQLDLPKGATLLITGIGGGVGVAAAQIAVARGLRVVGTASAGKKEFVESLGATHVTPGPDVAARVRAVAPDGIDAVYDLVGGAALEAVAELVEDRTKLITAGDYATVTRLGGQPVQRLRNAEVLDRVAELAVSGALRPYVTRTFPLERAGEALRAVEEGHAQGKIVIEIGA